MGYCVFDSSNFLMYCMQRICRVDKVSASRSDDMDRL